VARVILLDTNLLLLLLVGSTKRDYVSKHKRLKTFDLLDFDILAGIVNKSADIVLTPHVLTETSNLARQIEDPIRSEIALTLRQFTLNGTEKLLPSRVAVERPEFIRLGLTDAMLLEAGFAAGIILTADFGLYDAALRAGIEAENFNHIRELRRDYQ